MAGNTKKQTTRKRRELKKVDKGQVHIQSTFNNTLVTVTDMQEKPALTEKFSNYAVLGRYVLKPEIFDLLDHQAPGVGGEIQLTDSIKTLCGKDKVLAVDFEGRRYDTGNLRGFLEATIDFALDHPETGEWLKGFLRDKAKEV